jgi:hypothetical protein
MLAHPAWPLRFTANGGFALVDQDSLEDLEASAAIIACTRRGHREDDPSFGVTQLEFQQGDLQLDRFTAELSASDDRLNVDATETIDLAASTIRLIQANIGDA